MTHPAKFNPDATPGYAYVQLADHLAARIASGELRPNTPLPAERRLASEYGVSVGTVRHATRLLRYRGLVKTIQSKGTYVVPSTTPDLPLKEHAIDHEKEMTIQ
ncbi:winged helix-turn-helix domain-containing protein [Amycolatopsis alkalitolerans]|uniref:Winged helix-turn-helix transcriptional regulator n=1 Tax=Amycolatopsis alkalitolerans TaxID=2547244 RepID=A0A5C4M1T8_9PSEU|nr:winged helix-turn-helix domain-containing protein [Amycolatopsis alkalitolerans]TNC23717.1 winged helix-turn-helix transcriptional regulator [Amycolatopsis alkalitolerans]